jgi:hypothetical protein
MRGGSRRTMLQQEGDPATPRKPFMASCFLFHACEMAGRPMLAHAEPAVLWVLPKPSLNDAPHLHFIGTQSLRALDLYPAVWQVARIIII